MQYGLLTPQNIVDHANATYLGAQNKAAQNNAQLYHCLKNSISQYVRETIVEEVGSYYSMNSPVGGLFFKYLMSKMVVDTVVTAAQMQENLVRLPNYMLQVDSDIEAFNKWVRVNRQSLLARGEQVDDLMIHLFAAYEQAQHFKFREYIANKKVAFEERSKIMADQLVILSATINEL
eukprot:3100369-Ditylum_brightwellii.AAC.1